MISFQWTPILKPISVLFPTGPLCIRVHIHVLSIQYLYRKQGGSRKTTVKLSTTINNIERDVINSENKQLLVQFFDFMKRADTSEKYQNNNLKALIIYSKFLRLGNT